MTNLSVSHWKTLSAHFDQLLDLPPAQRSLWLAHLAQRDAGLVSELRGLLSELDAAQEETFPDTQPGEGPAELAAPGVAGAQLGPYTLEALLGTRGTSGVWSARRSEGRFAPTVAIRMLPAVPADRTGQERLRREGLLLARLAHEHVAHVIDTGVAANGMPYLVREHVQGQRIDHYCDARQLDLRARVALFLDLLEAVAYAHHHLIVHGDLKPWNVLVTASGRVKLLDLGLPRLLGPAFNGMTPGGGGPDVPAAAYCAPEQQPGQPATTQSDIYALGVMLYQLLTAGLPAGPARQGLGGWVRRLSGRGFVRPSRSVVPPARQPVPQSLGCRLPDAPPQWPAGRRCCTANWTGSSPRPCSTTRSAAMAACRLWPTTCAATWQESRCVRVPRAGPHAPVAFSRHIAGSPRQR
jgi:serine/threonine protein kinase